MPTGHDHTENREHFADTEHMEVQRQQSKHYLSPTSALIPREELRTKGYSLNDKVSESEKIIPKHVEEQTEFYTKTKQQNYHPNNQDEGSKSGTSKRNNHTSGHSKQGFLRSILNRPKKMSMSHFRNNRSQISVDVASSVADQADFGNEAATDDEWHERSADKKRSAWKRAHSTPESNGNTYSKNGLNRKNQQQFYSQMEEESGRERYLSGYESELIPITTHNPLLSAPANDYRDHIDGNENTMATQERILSNQRMQLYHQQHRDPEEMRYDGEINNNPEIIIDAVAPNNHRGQSQNYLSENGRVSPLLQHDRLRKRVSSPGDMTHEVAPVVPAFAHYNGAQASSSAILKADNEMHYEKVRLKCTNYLCWCWFKHILPYKLHGDCNS